MSVVFEIKVIAIRTATVGNLSGVIKSVDFNVKGTDQGQSFNLPQTFTLSDPEAASFVPLNQVTEQNVVSWIEAKTEELEPVKAHITWVLADMVNKAVLQEAPLPWAPPAPEPGPAPAV